MTDPEVTVCFRGEPEARARASAAFAAEIVVLGPPAEGVDEAVHLRTAVVQAHTPLVLVLDADEIATSALAAELEALLARDHAAAAYRVRRSGLYLGRTVECSDWQGLGPIRVFDRRAAVGGGSDHSAGNHQPAGELRGEILATRAWSLQTMLQDIRRASREVGGGRPSATALLTAPISELWSSFWRRGGMGGGWAGLFLATMDSLYVLVCLGRRYARVERAEDTATASRA